jgi:hypothetical protein
LSEKVLRRSFQFQAAGGGGVGGGGGEIKSEDARQQRTGQNWLWSRDRTKCQESGLGIGQSDRKQQSRNREDKTQWAVDKGQDKVTGNSRAGIERTGHNGLWTRDRTK